MDYIRNITICELSGLQQKVQRAVFHETPTCIGQWETHTKTRKTNNGDGPKISPRLANSQLDLVKQESRITVIHKLNVESRERERPFP